MSHPDFETVAARADLCRLLSACYYEPGPEFTEERLFDAMIDAAARLDPTLAEPITQLKAAFEAADPEGLLVDYAKLFLGPNGTLAPPYESAWRQQLGDPADDALQPLLDLYDSGGFELDPDFRDLPDHVAVELEFLYTLEFQLAASIQAKDPSAVEHAGTLRWALLNQHIGVWLKPFTQALREQAETPFYRLLGEITLRFLKQQLASAPGQ